jgi:hypothetical protein
MLIATMPKAAVHKHGDLGACERDVDLATIVAGNCSNVNSVAQSTSVKL